MGAARMQGAFLSSGEQHTGGRVPFLPTPWWGAQAQPPVTADQCSSAPGEHCTSRINGGSSTALSSHRWVIRHTSLTEMLQNTNWVTHGVEEGDLRRCNALGTGLAGSAILSNF